MLNNVNCQFKFGVFTRYDEDLQDEEEQENIKTTDDTGERQQMRENYKGDFQSFVNDKCEVYFVDAKHFITAKVRFVRIVFLQSDWLPEPWKRDKLRYWRVL